MVGEKSGGIIMAISKEKIKNITAEDVLRLTDEYSIFRYYLGEFVVGRKFKNPLYKDKNAGCIIRMVDGKLMLRDYGDDSWNGDCFSLVKRMYNCNFGEALKIIDKDMNLGLFNRTTERNRIITFNKPKIREHKPPKIFTETTHIHPVGREYLAQYHLTLKDMNFCKDTKVRYVNELVINYKREPIGKLAIEYELKNERGKWKKIYRPFANKDNRWRSTVPNSEIMGLSCMEKCDILLISKSMKDASVLFKFTKIPTIVVQTECDNMFTEETISYLNKLCKNIYCSFDSDEPGKKANIAVTRKTGWKHINVPDDYNSKDWADLVKDYSPDELIKHFKNKELI